LNTSGYIGIAGTVMIAYGFWSYFGSGDAAEQPETSGSNSSEFHTTTVDGREQAKLVNVSVLWTGNTIKLEELAVNWREDVGSNKAVPTPLPKFFHKEISDFYLTYIDPIKHLVGARKVVINSILSILDKEGMCPCVVRDQKELYENYDDETFAELAKIPLFRHSLAVARKCIASVADEVLIPNILIVSLGHDLGKIPAHHNKYYRSSDHPEISSMILAGIPEYITLPNRRELDGIIKAHHQLSPKNKIALLLKQCDQEARKDEMGAVLAPLLPTPDSAESQSRDEKENYTVQDVQLVQNGQRDSESNEKRLVDPMIIAEVEQPTVPEPLGMQSVVILTGSQAPEQQVEKEERGNIYTPRKVDISSWFDPGKIVDGIREIINQIERTSTGIHWYAVTAPDGLLYVRTDGLWQVLRKQFAIADLRMGDGDESQKRNILLSVVWALSEKEITVTEGMGETYYFIKANVISSSNKSTSMLLIPFRISAFGELPSNFEMQKPPLLKSLVKSIRRKDD